jgi:hypothetical protein
MNGETISPLRRRMIEDMTVRKFVEKTQRDYLSHVKGLTIFLGGRSSRPLLALPAGAKRRAGTQGRQFWIPAFAGKAGVEGVESMGGRRLGARRA